MIAGHPTLTVTQERDAHVPNNNSTDYDLAAIILDKLNEKLRPSLPPFQC